MAQIPARCPDCGNTYRSGIVINGTVGFGSFVQNNVSQCPYCAGRGKVVNLVSAGSGEWMTTDAYSAETMAKWERLQALAREAAANPRRFDALDYLATVAGIDKEYADILREPANRGWRYAIYATFIIVGILALGGSIEWAKSWFDDGEVEEHYHLYLDEGDDVPPEDEAQRFLEDRIVQSYTPIKPKIAKATKGPRRGQELRRVREKVKRAEMKILARYQRESRRAFIEKSKE